MVNNLKLQDVQVRIGDTISFSYSFTEKGKEKNQVFSGIVISTRGRGENSMFTVRKMTKSKIGIERIFPVHSSHISKVSIKKHTTNTKAKVFYIRSQSEKYIRERLY